MDKPQMLAQKSGGEYPILISFLLKTPPWFFSILSISSFPGMLQSGDNHGAVTMRVSRDPLGCCVHTSPKE